MVIEKFDGRVTIRVNFKNRIQYEKFRKYVLKTSWTYDLDHPLFEELICEFHNCEDLEEINRRIFYLLQIGFDVYCCRYQMDQSVEEEEKQQQDIESWEFDPNEFNLKEMCNDLWKNVGGKMHDKSKIYNRKRI